MQIFLIVLGGVLGTLSRYFLTTFVNHVGSTNHSSVAFPLGTLTVNLIGAFTIGCLFTLFANNDNVIKPFLMIGFLGAFTTMSGFTYEAMTIFEDEAYIKAIIYALLGSGGPLIACCLGVQIVKRLA
ncbi:MAG: fluoride efflux transporter CrcB [Oligoflexales bacterium]|nr:fluoride efflux transporter CrcB [Oligoflexales bacterium]